VRTRWNDANGNWQRLVVEEGNRVKSEVSIVTHEGCYLEMVSEPQISSSSSSSSASSFSLLANAQRQGEYGARPANQKQSFQLRKIPTSSSLTSQGSNGSMMVNLVSQDGAYCLGLLSDGVTVGVLPFSTTPGGGGGVTTPNKACCWVMELINDDFINKMAPLRIGFILPLINGGDEKDVGFVMSHAQWFGELRNIGVV
jgi:hypothetical protein